MNVELVLRISLIIIIIYYCTMNIFVHNDSLIEVVCADDIREMKIRVASSDDFDFFPREGKSKGYLKIHLPSLFVNLK